MIVQSGWGSDSISPSGVLPGEFDQEHGKRRDGSAVAYPDAECRLLRPLLDSRRLPQERMQLVLLRLYRERVLLILSGQAQGPQCHPGNRGGSVLACIEVKARPFWTGMVLGSDLVWGYAADKEVVVSQRGEGERHPEAHRHRLRADLRHQQCQGRVPQRAPAAEARQGSDQHLRDLLPEPAGVLPVLLSRVQGSIFLFFSP